MPKRSRKPPSDVNQAAISILQAATDEPIAENLTPTMKNPAAVALGRLGGMKGGKARAEALSTEERIAIAKVAAEVRWRKTKH